jgi:DNA-binding HxlR family transcriptional regulator
MRCNNFDKITCCDYTKDMKQVPDISSKIGCVDAATQILGDKWTPRLLRYFVNEETVRFCNLQDFVDGINPRTLSARLDRLEQEDIIVKLPTSASNRCEYSLTAKGRDLLPVLQGMQAWSDKYAPQLVPIN